MSDHEDTATSGLSRREAIKKGAIVGGAALWVSPVIQNVGISAASGQTTSPAPAQCRFMTGGGRVVNGTGDRAFYGFNLQCGKLTASPGVGNHLNIVGNTETGERFHFQLTALTVATCDWTGDPAPPAADFNRFTGRGTGQAQESGGPMTSGYTIDFVFVDNGEPGTADQASFTIRGPSGAVVYTTGGLVTVGNGNLQAHQGGNQRSTGPCR